MVRVSVLNDALVSLASFDKCARRIVERESWRNMARVRIGTLLGMDAERDMETGECAGKVADLQNNIVNAERRGKRQVMIRPSSKVVVKVLAVMQKHGKLFLRNIRTPYTYIPPGE